MRRLQRYVAPLLVVLLMAPGPLLAAQSGVVTPLELDNAISMQIGSDAEARQTIQKLLAREDVRALAQSYGLDASRASAAASTLQGSELQSVAQQAAAVNAQLAGGDTVIRISLVALLLIIIIVILLTND